ncbi:hypothetical protein, partial [Ferruginibacter sp.]
MLINKAGILICFLLVQNFCFSQSFSEVIFKTGGYYGYSVGKKDGVKKIMLSTGQEFIIEKNLKESWYITFGIELTSLKYNYHSDTLNSSVFSNNYFALIPVTLKRYYILSKRSHCFLDFGLAPAYYFYNKDESKSSSFKKNNLGLNIGAVAKMGFKTQLTKKLSFDVGLHSFQDFIYSYKNAADKLSIKSNGLMTSFYLDIK